MRGLVSWFVRNPVAANLLMMLIVVGGLVTVGSIKQDLLPEIKPGIITVQVVYPGAAPEDIEEGICVKVEEAVQDIEGIKRLRSTAVEGVGSVTIELETGLEPREVIDKVRTRVDAIDTFPDEAEKPVIREVEPRMHVINVAVYGGEDEAALKRAAERVRDELTALPNVSQVQMGSARPYEIAIEVSEEALKRWSLTFDDVAAAVRRSSVELPGGTVKEEAGEILLRAEGRARAGREFESMPVKTLPDGSRVLLGAVAKVKDDFEDSDVWTRFDGKPAIVLTVFRVGDQGVLEVADAVKKYVARLEGRAGPGVSLATYWDNSLVMRGRLNLLINNGLMGLSLVFISLLLFFRFRLAFWVSAGLPVAFLGAIWLLPAFGVTINLLSLFSFVLVLGILVDDSIVVSENVYRHMELGRGPQESAIEGTMEVMLPVFLAVSTNVVAFIPMLIIPGIYGDFTRVIPLVVIPCMMFSLVEALFILPQHLSHMRVRGEEPRRWSVIWLLQSAFQRGLDGFVRRIYAPLLGVATRWRYATLAFGLATLLVTVGAVGGGLVPVRFFPQIEADFAIVYLSMPQGTPASATDRAVKRLEEAAHALRKEIEGDKPGSVVRHVLTSVGTQPARAAQNILAGRTQGAHLGELVIELAPSEERTVRTADIIRRWRELAGPIADATEITFSGELQSAGRAIDVQISGPRLDDLRAASEKLKAKLAEYPGVFDISDSFLGGKREIRLTTKPAAEALGLSEADLARQVRQAFYGEEAQTFQRGKEEVKVMVRYPAEHRRSLGDVESMRIRTRSGAEVPFAEVAEVRGGRGPAIIQRAERRRSVSVTADVDRAVVDANEVLLDLKARHFKEIESDFGGVRFSVEGERREQQEMLASLQGGVALSMMVIFALLAIATRSYLQPAIIMVSIPFGVAGAIWAHVFLGMSLSFMSFVGVLALTGVVVNDAIVMMDFINRAREAGKSAEEAVAEAGPVRFRPILLTTLTTFAGMGPLILEKSMQAQFLIPMAVSLAFGLVFATGITLVIVPSLYLILEDARRLVRRAMGRPDVPAPAAQAPPPEPAGAEARR